MQRSSGRPVLTLVVLVVAAILLIAGLTSRGTQVEGPFSFIATPIQSALASVSSALNAGSGGSADVALLQQRVQDAETELALQRADNIRLREFQAEVNEYRNLMNFSRSNPTYGVVGADVIGIGDRRCTTSEQRPRDQLGICANVIAGDPSPYVRYVVINAGEQEGVRVGMPVVGGGFGLVGRIGQVNQNSSHVQLLIDTGSFVNVQAVDTRAAGTVTGKTDGSLVLQNVPQTSELKVGDQLVTSGLSGNLPKLLPVGTIEQITSTDAQLFKEAIVRPSVDFNRIETVLVIASNP